MKNEHKVEMPEGELTKLRAAIVCEQALYHVAEFATNKCRIIPLSGQNGG